MSAELLPRRLLIAVPLGIDAAGDEAAAQFLTRTADFATALKAEVLLLHVIDVEDDDVDDATRSLYDDLAANARERLDALLPILRERKLGTELRIAAGRPWQKILDAADDWKPDAVVVGPPAPEPDGVLRRTLHRPTAGRLIREADRPVWALPESESSGFGIRRILVPVDFSEVSTDQVKLADELHAVFGCERYLLHCFRYRLMDALRRFPDRGGPADRFEDEMIAKAKAKAEALLGEAYDNWTVLLHTDPVKRAVPMEIENYGIDLLLLAGVSKPRGLRGALLGSTAEKILAYTNINACVLKPTATGS